jgi:hypothetical protein
MTQKHVTARRIYQQRHRTEVVRKEVVLNAAYNEDRAIIDYINTLPRGGFSDAFRQAFLLLIEHERNPPRTISDDFGDWMADVSIRLEDLQSRPVMQAERVIERVTERVAFSTPSSDDDDDIEMEIVAAENTNAGQNFLDSLLALNS